MSFGTILTMAGGLGLFLFGMELMSDSIEKVAGARLRRILEIFTTQQLVFRAEQFILRISHFGQPHFKWFGYIHLMHRCFIIILIFTQSSHIEISCGYFYHWNQFTLCRNTCRPYNNAHYCTY